MKHSVIKHYYLIPVLLLLIAFSCKNHKEANKLEQLEGEISSILEEFELKDVDYLIASVESGDKISNIASDNQVSGTALEPIIQPLLLKLLHNEGFTDTSFSYVDDSIHLSGEDMWTFNYSVASKINRANLLKFYKKIIETILRDSPEGKSIINDVFKSENESIDTKTLLKRAYKISSYLHQSSVSGYNKDTLIENRYQTDYLRGVSEYLGWKTLIFNKQLVFWTYFESNENTVLILNWLNNGVFAGFVYPNEELPSLKKNICEDLLNNVFISTSLNVLCNASQIKKDNLLNKKGLKSRINTYRFKERISEAKVLEKQYGKLYPNDKSINWNYSNLIASIDYVGDDVKEHRYFKIERDTTVQLFTAGQTMTEIWGSDRVYGRDYVNIILRAVNKDITIFRSKFYYKYPYINGSKKNKEPYPLAFKDIDDTEYYFEVSIDWDLKELKNKYGSRFEIYLEVGDSDEKPRETEGSLSIAESFLPVMFGEQGSFSFVEDKRIAIHHTTDTIAVDGYPEETWERTNWQDLSFSKGEIDNKEDLSSSYKVLYNGEMIYFLFKIKDQAKQYPWLQSKDFCRIVNTNTGNLVWQIAGQRSEFFPFYFDDNTFKLPKGEYYLEYVADDRLSFANWYDETLPTDYYGAYLFYVDDKKSSLK